MGNPQVGGESWAGRWRQRLVHLSGLRQSVTGKAVAGLAVVLPVPGVHAVRWGAQVGYEPVTVAGIRALANATMNCSMVTSLACSHLISCRVSSRAIASVLRRTARWPASSRAVMTATASAPSAVMDVIIWLAAFPDVSSRGPDGGGESTSLSVTVGPGVGSTRWDDFEVADPVEGLDEATFGERVDPPDVLPGGFRDGPVGCVVVLGQHEWHIVGPFGDRRLGVAAAGYGLAGFLVHRFDLVLVVDVHQCL